MQFELLIHAVVSICHSNYAGRGKNLENEMREADRDVRLTACRSWVTGVCCVDGHPDPARAAAIGFPV